jgi:hypothetical protein
LLHDSSPSQGAGNLGQGTIRYPLRRYQQIFCESLYPVRFSVTLMNHAGEICMSVLRIVLRRSFWYLWFDSPLIKGDKGGCVFSGANTTPCTPFSKGEFSSLAGVYKFLEKKLAAVSDDMKMVRLCGC